jgi:hypothetical protein
MVFDERRGRVVVFGGHDGTKALGDTWEYSLATGTWTSVATAHKPSPRYDAEMVYDKRRGLIVLFGGTPGQYIFYNDTWEYDGTDWRQITTAHSPPGALDGAMVYDEARGRVVLVTGWQAQGFGWVNETWEYDGTDWTYITQAPSWRYNFALAYDLARQRVVLFGGYEHGGIGCGLGDTWEYDGQRWTRITTPHAPPGRCGHAMTYDPLKQRVVLFGGDVGGGNYYGDTWEYDGSDWYQVPTSHRPPGRVWAALTVAIGGQEPTPITYTPTPTKIPTLTLPPTPTRMPIHTPTWTPTRKPTPTKTPTRTPTPMRGPTRTPTPTPTSLPIKGTPVAETTKAFVFVSPDDRNKIKEWIEKALGFVIEHEIAEAIGKLTTKMIGNIVSVVSLFYDLVVKTAGADTAIGLSLIHHGQVIAIHSSSPLVLPPNEPFVPLVLIRPGDTFAQQDLVIRIEKKQWSRWVEIRTEPLMSFEEEMQVFGQYGMHKYLIIPKSPLQLAEAGEYRLVALGWWPKVESIAYVTIDPRGIIDDHNETISWNGFPVLNNQWGWIMRPECVSYGYQMIGNDDKGNLLFIYQWKSVVGWGQELRTCKSQVKGYPAVIAGWHYGNLSGYLTRMKNYGLPARIKERKQFLTSVLAFREGRGGIMNLAWDIWIASDPQPQKPKAEVMIWPWYVNQQPITDGGGRLKTVTIGGIKWDLYRGKNPDGWWVYTFRHRMDLKESGSTILLPLVRVESKVNLGEFVQYLVQEKYLSEEDWIVGIEFGSEIIEGKGKWRISKYLLEPGGSLP